MTSRALPSGDRILARLRELHHRMLVGLRRQLLRSASEDLAAPAEVRGGDAIYRIDEKGEQILLDFCADWSREAPFLLIAEGLGETGERMFPEGADRESAAFRLIVDPIDGTRGLMYNKRSAWILSAVAPDRGPETGLRDLRWAS